MKASDLMIGDWVYDTHSYNYNKEKEPVKLDRNEFVELICGCTGNNDLDLGDMYEPVTLTGEILKANGFVYNKGCWWFRKVLFTLNEFIDGGYCAAAFHEQVFINNVHELQHALRLCGLDELADNFKL